MDKPNLWDEYIQKGNWNEIIRLGLFPPFRFCHNKKCKKKFEPTDLAHIYCTPDCHQNNKLVNSYKRVGVEYDAEHTNQYTYQNGWNEDLYIEPIPALLHEGSIVCCNCSSKLPRQNTDHWKLVARGYLCVKCQSRMVCQLDNAGE